MPNFKLANHPQKQQRIIAIIIVIAIALLGSIILFVSKAAQPYASVSADRGILTAPAALVNDASALSGKSVMFGPAPVTTCTVNCGGTGPIPAPTSNLHNEYVFTDRAYYVYSREKNWALTDTVPLTLPGGELRDAIADTAGNMYISFGINKLMKWNYITKTQVWLKSYTPGTDAAALSPDGSTLYMATGSFAPPNWLIIRTSDGTQTGTIKASGSGSHNTDISVDGRYVYLGIHNTTQMGIYDTKTTSVSYVTGLTGGTGIRPIAVTKKYGFICETGLFGFSTGDLTTGRTLYTSHITGFPSTSPGYVASGSNIPSHGCSVSPDEKEVWVVDKPNGMVHVFDVTGLPGVAPKQVKDIALASMDGNETECSKSCFKEGWVQYSRDGNYVFVGDTGKAVDAHTKLIAADLPMLHNSRKNIEIDFNNGAPVWASPTRSQQGYMP